MVPPLEETNQLVGNELTLFYLEKGSISSRLGLTNIPARGLQPPPPSTDSQSVQVTASPESLVLHKFTFYKEMHFAGKKARMGT